MTKLLIKLFVRNPEGKDDTTRFAYGKLAAGTGIGCNIILFAAKVLLGVVTASVAIIADAFNNLSDAGSSIVTLFGFKLSESPPDEEHPFGHGRMEYLSALGVAALIMIAGYELAASSVEKILHPTLPQFSIVTIIILAVAMAVKVWMALFFRKIGTTIDSEALLAAFTDSRNDVLCTALVLVSSAISWMFHITIDGYVGVLVAAFVLWSGFSVMRETVSPLLGQAPPRELVEGITATVLACEDVCGIHDLIVHNYGPGRVIVSLHAEVPHDADVMKSHDTIDLIERQLNEKYGVMACIHMDPVDIADETTAELKEMAQKIVTDVDPRLTLHDFRVVHGETHTNLIFDLVVPFDMRTQQDAIAKEIAARIHENDPHYYAVITPEQSFV